jgi:uncharacterized protein (DUF2235 family)
VNLAEELGNVVKVYYLISRSHENFYRYQELVEEGGIDNLINKSRQTPNSENWVNKATERAVVDYALEIQRPVAS